MNALFDSNVWVALTLPQHPHHRAATVAFAARSLERPAVFCRATQQSFLRLTTTPVILKAYGAAAYTNSRASLLLQWLQAFDSVVYRDEPFGMMTLWQELAALDRPQPALWMDAYLAAFAIVGRYEFVTFDRGFKVFEQAGLQLLLLEAA